MRKIDQILIDMVALGTSPETIDQDIKKLRSDILDWLSTSNGEMSITLRQARVNMGMTFEEVSERTGISIRQLKKYEENSKTVRFDKAATLCELYKISINHIYFGPTPDLRQKKNHLAVLGGTQ